MAAELRDLFNQTFIHTLSNQIQSAYPQFNEERFYSLIFDNTWDDLTLKQRVRHITLSLHSLLPFDYKEAVEILKKTAPHFEGGLTGIIFPDYIEVYGLEDWHESMEALEFFTKYSTAEFAVRPFVIKNQPKMIEQFLEWSNHSNEHVRRLASEGSRPRLPWGIALATLKKDPRPILPILENLKEDPSLYVRKSVANNLNDISKDHPDLVIDIAKKWFGLNEKTNWIIKRGIRTLAKKGNQQVLTLFGFASNSDIKVMDLNVSDKIQIGDTFSFSFSLLSTDKKPIKIRVEYVIDFVKSNGKQSPKVFKITENTLQPGVQKEYFKNHAFKDLTTRKHYPGTHKLSIIVNGEVKAIKDFIVHYENCWETE